MTPDPVTVTHQDGNGTWLIALHGEHDLATIPQLEHATAHLWPRCTSVVVDFSDTSFIDCSVVEWLVRAQERLDDSSHEKLRVIPGDTSIVQRVFQLLDLDQQLACYPTREAALPR